MVMSFMSCHPYKTALNMPKLLLQALLNHKWARKLMSQGQSPTLLHILPKYAALPAVSTVSNPNKYRPNVKISEALLLPESPASLENAEFAKLPANLPKPPASVVNRPVLKVPFAKLGDITLLSKLIAEPSKVIDPMKTNAPPRKNSHIGLPLQIQNAEPTPMMANSTAENIRSLTLFEALPTARFKGIREKPYTARVRPDCDDDQLYS